ncbi:post-transcriptional regulator [Paenibacillus tarimensis]
MSMFFEREWKSCRKMTGERRTITGKRASRSKKAREYEMTDEEMNRTIEELCNSKAEEFRLIGYEQVTGREVWECVSDKYHKHGQPALHQIVNDILSLKVTRFMNFMTLNAFRGARF